MNGSPDSLRSLLTMAGIQRSEIELDHTTHTVRVSIGHGDEGQAAAQCLWESLPAGVLTLGDESYGIADMVGGTQIVRLSRIEDDSEEVSMDEKYDVRGRVFQPLEEGWVRINPTPKSLFYLYEQGCVGWDAHANEKHLILWVDHRCPPVVSDLLAHPSRTSEVRRFEFSQPEPENMDYMTAQDAANLLDESVPDILTMMQFGRNPMSSVQVEWGGCRTMLLPGPKFLSVDTDSLHRFLIDRGFAMEGSPEVGDPVAYIQARKKTA